MESDLFRLLLPNDHAHIPKGKAAMWDRHHDHRQPQTQRAPSATPTRPHSSNRSSFTSPPLHSPRHSLVSPIKTLTPRCKSAGPSSSPRRQPLTARAATEPRMETARRVSQKEVANTQANQLPLDDDAREHLELKACMLAHMHRIDVDALRELREDANHEMEVIRTKQMLACGGILDDGSLLQTTKRKTSFLLRHFFALGEISTTAGPTRQDTVLHDVIDEWSCHENASADDIAALWKSINSHIERSYVLRRQLVPKADPNPLSITIAMDCLRKLPAKLPDYRRMLDVIISLVESGLYLPLELSNDEPDHGSGDPSTANAQQSRRITRRYYFNECQALQDALDKELEEKQARLAAEAQNDAARTQTPRQQLQALLNVLGTASASHEPVSTEMETLFSSFFHADVDRFLPVALRDALQACFVGEQPRDDRRRLFFGTWMPLLGPNDATEVLVQLTAHHIAAFQNFFLQEFDAMDKLLMAPIASAPAATSAAPTARRSSTTTASSSGSARRTSIMQPPPGLSSDSPALTLFHALIERHPAQFVAVLWSSPFLTAHVFQDSQHLIARILEQNIVSVSQVLHQRPEVLSILLNHTLKDNSFAIEEFLNHYPKAFSDLLMNKAPAVAAAIKSYPSILVDILQASRPTLAKVLLSMPELLCHLFKSTPELLAQIIREDLSILPLAFSVVPQSLSDALERHPEFFVDVAHRKPALVAKLFAKYPDLLLEPLEANPSVFTNFLVYHRKLLPDFSNPTFDPSFYQFERKQFVNSGQQTEKRLCKYDGKLRMREQMKFQEDALVYEVRQAVAAVEATISANGRSTPGAGNGRTTPALPSERVSTKDARGVHGGLLAPSPGQVVSEITRTYMKKFEEDTRTDARRKKRRVLADFVLDLYIHELGFKRKAQKKLTLLLTGAKQAEHESLRIKWFLRFMNVGDICAPVASLSSTGTVNMVWTYHPLACEFYGIATQFLVALPIDELSKRLEDELARPCLVGYTRVKLFLEDPFVARMLPGKDQRQQLMAAICEKENLIHGASSDHSTTAKTSPALSASALHLEDVLESLMVVWTQYQDSVRGAWTIPFQLVNPDGSGVLRYSVFADLIRAKMPAIDDRAIMKIYHQCGEENDLGEYFIAVDDFSLAMSIIQEQDAIHQFTARMAPTPASLS